MLQNLIHKKHFLSISLILLALLIFAASFKVQSFVEESFHAIEELIKMHEAAGLTLFIALSALSAMLSPFSIVPFIPIAILAWGAVPAIFIVLAGWVLGGSLAFALARFFGRPFLKKFISLETIDHYVEKLPSKLEFEALLVFRLAMPAEIPGYVVGLLKIPFGKYFLATFLSELPFSAISVYGSEAFLEKQYIAVIIWILVATIIIGLMFSLFRKILRQYKQEKYTV